MLTYQVCKLGNSLLLLHQICKPQSITILGIKAKNETID